MNKLALVARLLLGAIFFVFGLNGFFQFLPMPDMPEPAGKFMGALVETGYFMVFLKLTETLCGLLLLIGRFVPLALTVLAPVVLNIVLFHLFLAPGGIAVGAVAFVLLLYLAWAYRSSYRGVLNPTAHPD